MRSPLLTLSFLLLLPSLGLAQRKEGIIIFKDGFTLSGKVVEPRSFIIDPASNKSFTIPKAGGLINIDDVVRRIFFIPGQLQEVLEKKNVDRGEEMVLKKFAVTTRGDAIMPGWVTENATPWDNKWQRSLKILVTNLGAPKHFYMDQRIILATPQYLHIQTVKYNWDLFYLTKEYGPEMMRSLLGTYFAEKQEKKEWEKRKEIARFMFQAGWYQEAQRELDNLVEEYPTQKEAVAGLRETIKKVLADVFVENIEKAFKAGQHQEVQERLALYAKENMGPLVNEKNLLLAQDLKNKYDALNEKIAQAKGFLKAFPKRVLGAGRNYWTTVADRILEELNYDTLDRLDTFVVFGQQHKREVDENKAKPTQSTEEVLALALSGWILGNTSAEPDVKNARKLLQARDFVLEYQKTENTAQRGQMLTSFFRDHNIPLDVMSRIIRLLPPPFAYDKEMIDTQPTKLTIELPDSPGGDYHLQLPPDYHHHRNYPVLLLLHGQGEKADKMMAQFSDLAAQYGFILAAPHWAGNGFNQTYTYSAKEHAIVLDTLRDLRRRFQVDSDRVFLFGFRQGGDAALDIGMSHPDQFAGVLSMCGAPRYFVAEQNRYQTNAQYVPFYLVDGDRDGTNPKFLRSLFHEWVKGIYPSIYVEYKGRGSEWYGAELPTMFDWMSRKKRHHPAKELGRYNTSGLYGEEFRTMRETDNRFYWLSTENLDDRFVNSPSHWVRSIQPASMTATIGVGNELTVKSGGKKDANIWTQINIRTKGVKQLSVWLAPHMVDFTKPILLRVNSSNVGIPRIVPPNPGVLLEDFYYNGDRQRLFFARIDLKF